MTEFYSDEAKLHIAVDGIIMGFKEGKLKLLIGKRRYEPGKGAWSLYGGFLRKDESLDDAAHRVLYQYTGIKNLYMRQVGAFGSVDRDPGDRVISIAYCALINVDDYDTSLLGKYGLMWADIEELPELFGDHPLMVRETLKQLRKKINTEPLSFNLLPDLFTLTQLQKVYEAVLGQEIDKRNFRKRIKQIDFIEKTNLIDKVTSKRGAALYRFNKRAYDDAPNFKL
jgi:8-oxo-dGTP diphosphatase